VGKVTSITLGAGGYPRVSLRLDRGVDVRRGARVALRLASLSGERNRYLALDPGDGPSLPDGAVLGRAATRSPVELDDGLSALGPRTRTDVRVVLAALRRATDGRGRAVRATLRTAGPTLGSVTGALRDVDADGAALRTLVRDSRALSATLAGGRSRIGDSVERVAATLRVTAARSRTLRETVAALPGALVSTTRTLDGARAALPALEAVVRAAAPGVGRRPRAAARADALLRAARPVLGPARALVAGAPEQLRALRALLRTATPVLGRLTPALRRSAPMLDQARVRLPDVFSFFSAWADFTSSYDANGHAARVGIVLPPAPTRRASADGVDAGQLAKPFLRTPGALQDEPWRDYAQSFVAGEGG